jgi:hypothetical protein
MERERRRHVSKGPRPPARSPSSSDPQPIQVNVVLIVVTTIIFARRPVVVVAPRLLFLDRLLSTQRITTAPIVVPIETAQPSPVRSHARGDKNPATRAATTTPLGRTTARNRHYRHHSPVARRRRHGRRWLRRRHVHPRAQRPRRRRWHDRFARQRRANHADPGDAASGRVAHRASTPATAAAPAAVRYCRRSRVHAQPGRLRGVTRPRDGHGRRGRRDPFLRDPFLRFLSLGVSALLGPSRLPRDERVPQGLPGRHPTRRIALQQPLQKVQELFPLAHLRLPFRLAQARFERRIVDDVAEQLVLEVLLAPHSRTGERAKRAKRGKRVARVRIESGRATTSDRRSVEVNTHRMLSVWYSSVVKSRAPRCVSESSNV